MATTRPRVDRLEAAIMKLPYDHADAHHGRHEARRLGRTTGGFVARMSPELEKDKRSRPTTVVKQIRALSALVPGGVLTVRPKAAAAAAATRSSTRSRVPKTDRAGCRQTRRGHSRDSGHGQRADRRRERSEPRSTSRSTARRRAVLGVSPGRRLERGADRHRRRGGDAGAHRDRAGRRARAVAGAVAQSLADMENIKVRANDGVSLYRLSRRRVVQLRPAPTKIERLDKQRIVRVTGGFDPVETKLGAVTQKINAAVEKPGFFPEGVALRADGDSKFFAETFSSMGLAMLTSFALVYVLMVILYSSFLTPFVIMFSVPVALVGALYGWRVTHQTLNLFSLIGIIMLFGLVAKNGILLVDYANTHAPSRLARRRGDARGGGYSLAADRHDDGGDGVRHAAARTGPGRRRRVSAFDGHRADRRTAQLADLDAVPRAGGLRVGCRRN